MRIYSLVLLVLISCTGAKVTNSNRRVNKTALAVLEYRQSIYNIQNKAPEIDKLADSILNKIFCPNKTCTDGNTDSLKALKNTLRYPQTKYESLLERYYLSIDVYTIERILNKTLGFDLNDILVYPSNCRCYNAMAIPLENWNLPHFYLLEINNGLSLDIGELSKVSSRMIPYTDESKISKYDKKELKQYLNGDYQTMEDFGVKLVGHLFSDITPDEQSLSVDPSKLLYYSAFFRTMKSFVIAHEYSHAILKHKAAYSSISFVHDYSQVTLEVVDYPSKNLEFEADSLAFEVINEYAQHNESFKQEAVYAGVELWYLWLDMFQKMELLVHGNYKGNSTHPSAIDRRIHIRQIFADKIPATVEYQNLISSLETAFEIYWEILEPRFESAKPMLRSESLKTECFK